MGGSGAKTQFIGSSQSFYKNGGAPGEEDTTNFGGAIYTDDQNTAGGEGFDMGTQETFFFEEDFRTTSPIIKVKPVFSRGRQNKL